MGKLNKFENVDVFASLEAIMKQNTGFYQSDFDIDKKIIAEKAASQNPADKTFSSATPPRIIHGVSTRSRPATLSLLTPWS